MNKQIIKYRGVRPAHLISVCEGDGKDIPFEIVDYVLVPRNDGVLITYGKIIKLSPEEQSFIGKDL